MNKEEIAVWTHIARQWEAHPVPPQGRVPLPAVPPEVTVTNAMFTTMTQAYLAGSADYRAQTRVGPPSPADAPAVVMAVLWEYYWNGYRYSESVAHAQTTHVTSTGPSKTKIQDPEPYKGNKDKFEDFAT